jgi:hypothetical protein
MPLLRRVSKVSKHQGINLQVALIVAYIHREISRRAKHAQILSKPIEHHIVAYTLDAQCYMVRVLGGVRLFFSSVHDHRTRETGELLGWELNDAMP